MTALGGKPTGPERVCAVRVEAGQAGGTVLDFVAGRFTYLTREQWQQELVDGRLRVNGEPVPPERLLAAADRVSYRGRELAEPPVASHFSVVYEDDDLLVVNKPAPLPCHPGGRYFRHTLWRLLQERCGVPKPLLVNRLDRETSGLVVVAKKRAAARDCARQWQEQQVEKRYLVLVEGEFPLGAQAVAGFLAPDPASLVRKKSRFFPADQAAPAGAVSCATAFRLLALQGGISLLEARPLTGRCHQIRATLCSLGFPVVGDKIYGLDEELFLRFLADRLSSDDRRRLRLPRQALHSAGLKMRHPADHRPLEFTCPLPPEMAGLLPQALPVGAMES
ncbi:RluA family pseudouridine synthase [Desulfurivibrio alkaliphilus]|uniref:Pseudouridine synthase n=1 Tax=Desulfurivibrio alkaliphilus (strain DSM 19089 / UNIQEM U267 / AHT2) TaxID=589865 RepID=D6Z5Y2_DESAT|nr:RluA family pseudouridine synthase [Desulfurivibrio alkaliphilus]ADH84864.1 pseudouridine synthase, RluA family [Desulfurivibrio alkaliphilus AHT 2]